MVCTVPMEPAVLALLPLLLLVLEALLPACSELAADELLGEVMPDPVLPVPEPDVEVPLLPEVLLLP